jgi:predicted lipoprotein with Yx(FWY)xxD motif
MSRLMLIVLAAAALVAAGCGDDESDAADGAPAADAAMKKEKAEDAMAGEDAMSAKGATVKVIDSQFGRVIADKRGEAFYLFDKEVGKRSRCYGECAVAWPPVLTKGKPRAGKGADADLLGTTKRRNGKLQVTYNGHPLYYYKDDEPGRILCHNVDEFGGLWLVVNPRGDAVS